MWSRLAGEQNNSYGEAMAFLQVLRHAHIKDTVDVFIDNLGVIQRWDGLQGHGIRGRVRGGGRTIWNRIYCLSRARREAGAVTRVHWVHSHVEEEERQNRQPKGKPGEGRSDVHVRGGVMLVRGGTLRVSRGATRNITTMCVMMLRTLLLTGARVL